MKITLNHIAIENFKGIKTFSADFSDTTDIYGRNASGKTTVVDAFTWLLFDRDSSDNNKFGIRPVDEVGDMIDNIEISVEAGLAITYNAEAPENLVLKKTQRQKWVKKRGQEQQEFSGNVNEYQINGFPARESEYKAKIESLFNADLFKLLTSPRYFPSMKWQDQRKTLLALIPDFSDTEILDSDPQYSLIREDVLTAGADKAKEKATKMLHDLKDEQKSYPVRIDEANKSIVDTGDLSELEDVRNRLTKQLSEVRQKLDGTKDAYSDIARIQDEIITARSQIAGIRSAAQNSLDKQRATAQKAKDAAQKVFDDLFQQRAELDRTISMAKLSVEQKQAQKDSAANQWKQIKVEKLSDDASICPTCGQRFPMDRVADIQANFASNKQRRLDAVTREGLSLKADIERLQQVITEAEKKKSEITPQLEQAQAEVNKAADALAGVPASADLSDNQEIESLEKQVSKLNEQLSHMDNGDALKASLRSQEAELEGQIAEINKKFEAVNANARAQERIKELTAQQRECSQKVASQEQIVYLLEQFTKQKMNAIGEKINSKFHLVKFKLFNMQVNGGIKETCEMTMNGVPYSDLNSAAKLQGGLDIINTLSEMYGVSAPIFIDNRESCTNIPKMDAQIINLYVSPQDVTLRVAKE